MPWPKICVERRLSIHFELIDISPILPDLFDRIQQGIELRDAIKYGIFRIAAIKRTRGPPLLFVEQRFNPW